MQFFYRSFHAVTLIRPLLDNIWLRGLFNLMGRSQDHIQLNRLNFTTSKRTPCYLKSKMFPHLNSVCNTTSYLSSMSFVVNWTPTVWCLQKQFTINKRNENKKRIKMKLRNKFITNQQVNSESPKYINRKNWRVLQYLLNKYFNRETPRRCIEINLFNSLKKIATDLLGFDRPNISGKNPWFNIH